ncbi:MAG: S-adenosyl-l-methionine hydroxide adenosyltransferase family protein [Betaproteobacteria bacterium]
MARPIIALLTDFGILDHYAAAMKGVALGIAPDANLVDITHEVPAHDVLAGALELAACYRYFPPGTVFLAVVDPGVGTDRRAIAVEAGDYRFVAPDNGVLSVVLDETPVRAAVELTERRYARPTVSRTFEGRDRFAPAAAWLAGGVALSALGRPAGDLRRLEVPAPVARGDDLSGEVLRVDRFGNLVSNIDRPAFDRFAAGRRLQVRAGGQEVPQLVTTYGEVGPGEVCALFGSSDHLEIAVNGGSAAERLRLSRGAAVHLTRRA